MEERYEIKISKLKKVTCKIEYEDKMNQRCERVRKKVVGRVEEEWRRFKETILEVGEEVCGTRKIREGKRRKGSEWWSEEIRRVVERKKEGFLIWSRTRSEEDLDEYRRMKRLVKRMIREAKKRVNEEWTLTIAENFKENKKKNLEGSKLGQKGGKPEVIVY